MTTNVQTSAVWSYCLGNESSNELDCSLSSRFTPFLMGSTGSFDDSDVDSIEMLEQEVALLEQESVLMEQAAAVWAFGAGSASASDLDASLSSRFTPVIQGEADLDTPLSPNRITPPVQGEADLDTSLSSSLSRVTPVVQASRNLVTMHADVEEPIRELQEDEINEDEQLSVGTTEQEKDDNHEEEDNNHEEEAAPPASPLQFYSRPDDEETIVAEGASDSEESDDYERPIAATTSPALTNSPRRRTISYSAEWDNLRLTPEELLSKMMPERVKEIQAIISSKQKRSLIEPKDDEGTSSPSSDGCSHRRVDMPGEISESTVLEEISESTILEESSESTVLKEISESTVLEETSEYEDLEPPTTATPSSALTRTPRRHSASNSEDSDNLRPTPEQLLPNMMPDKAKEAQAIIISSKGKSKKVTQRSQLYKMTREQRRAMLQSSLCHMDSTVDMIDPNLTESGHTASMSSLASWASIQERSSSAEEKKKWGVKYLISELQEKRKKKTEKSITKKGEKKQETDETSTKTKKKKKKKRSSLRKTSSTPALIGTVTSEAIQEEGATKKKKKKSTRRSAPDAIDVATSLRAVKQEVAKKKKKRISTDRTKDKKKKPKRKSSTRSSKSAASSETTLSA